MVLVIGMVVDLDGHPVMVETAQAAESEARAIGSRRRAGPSHALIWGVVDLEQRFVKLPSLRIAHF